MRVLSILLFTILIILYNATAAPTKSNLQTGQTPTNDEEGKPYIEEVTVESVLQVRSPAKFNRQYRTNTHTSLQDGARVEARQYN